MHHEEHHAKELTLSHVAVASHGALLAGGLRRAPRGQAHLRVSNIYFWATRNSWFGKEQENVISYQTDALL